MVHMEDAMQRAKEEQEVLVRDKNYVKYERLLARAEENGRLDGNFKCLTCGMKYTVKKDAECCCRVLL